MRLGRWCVSTVLPTSLVATVVALGAAHVPIHFSGKSPPGTPGLIVPLEGGNVGEVWESDAAVVRVPIRNTTARPIRIASLSAGCRVQRVEPTTCTVPAGGEVTVEVTLDLTGRQWPEMGLLSRPFELPLVATVEGEQRSIRWQITGTRRSRVAVSPIYLNFGESNVAGRPPVSRTVAVFLDDSAQTFGANSSSDLIRVVGRPGLNGGIRLVVTPDTTRIRGDFAGTILVTAIGHDGQVTGSTTVAVEGTVREPEPSRPADGGKQP